MTLQRNLLHGNLPFITWILISVTGKVNIQLNVNIPVDTELVEPLQEGCIWCQARGVSAIVSEVQDVEGPSEKVPIFSVCVCVE